MALRKEPLNGKLEGVFLFSHAKGNPMSKRTVRLPPALFIMAMLMMLALALWGCGAKSEKAGPPLLTPSSPTNTKAVLTRIFISNENIDSMEELRLLSGDDSNIIADLIFVSENREVLVVHAFSGNVNRWRLQDSSVSHQINLGPVSVPATQFSPDGKWIAIAAGDTEPALTAGLSVSMKGSKVFDVLKGEIIWQNVNNRNRWSTSYIDVAWNRNNTLLSSITPNGFTLVDTQTWHSVNNYTWMIEDISGESVVRLCTVAFDASSEWLLLGNTAGTLYAYEPYGIGIISWRSDVENCLLEAESSPSNRYVASIGTQDFVVWDVTKVNRWFSKDMHIQSKHSYTSAADLAFSPDGKLLAVGTKTMWQIWSVEEGELLKEHPQGSYALAFSPDGRLFAWGDLEGNVHIWGIPDSQ